MLIRPYSPNDLEPLLALIKAAFKEHEGVVDPPPSAASKTLAVLQEELSDFGALVVEDEGRLVGCVFYKPKDDSLYLGRLSVLPDYRGRGIASSLLKRLESEAHQRDLAALSLNVRLALKNQQNIYRHWGFEVSGYGTHEGYSNPTFLRMRKAL